MWRKISVLRRSTGKAVWVIIDITIREQEKRRKTRAQRGSSVAHLGHYTSVRSTPAKRRMKRGASSVGYQKRSLLIKKCGGLKRRLVHVHQWAAVSS